MKSIGQVNGGKWFSPLLINLGCRVDRMISSTAEAAKIDCQLIRIDAIDAHNLKVDSDFLTKGAVACWESHKQAMLYLTKSSYNFALIFEDDFKIENHDRFRRLISDASIFRNVDIFQFGFLVNDYKERIDLFFRNFENFVFSLLGKFNFVFLGRRFSFAHRLRVRRKQNLPMDWVADDFRAGAHAYLISKTAAKRILELNSPAFLTTDAFFSSLSTGKAFRIYRMRKSLVGQIDSASSIKNWGAEVTRGDQI